MRSGSPYECDGQVVDFVVTGQIGSGERFAPSHVVGSTSVFQPLIIDEIVEITPIGGTTETIVIQEPSPASRGTYPRRR